MKVRAVKNPQKIISYWKKQWRVVVLIVLTGTVFNASMSFAPVLQGRIIDILLSGGRTAQILRPAAVFVLVVVAVQLLRFLKRYYVRVFANRTGASMRQNVYNKLIHQSAADIADEKTGDLMTKVVSDVDACVEGMRKFTTEIFDTGVLMLSYLITLLYYGAWLTFCACAFIPAAILLAEKLKTVIFKYTKAYRAQLSEVSQLSCENAENAILYRICSADKANLVRYNSALAVLKKKAVLANVLENSMQPVYNIIAMTGVFAIVLFGGKNVAAGLWTVGDFSAYLTIFSALAVKASKAAKLFNSMQKAQVSWQRIKPYLAEVKEESTSAAEPLQPATLCVKSMAFTYPAAEKPTVQRISFSAKSGELIGITGPVASGKSTIGLALLGLYPYSGSICFNTKELSSCTSAEISSYLTYAGHESSLLSDTIYNNISLGTGGDIMPVLRDVCFEEDLAKMPQGVQTPVGASGVRLSGGQQARLALARALYCKSPVLVLDDPFAAVDIKTEERIVSNLKQCCKNRIIILISHRIACFKDADKVLLVNDGSAVCSTHDELLKTSDIYRNIVAMQREASRNEQK
ncbi:MAG: ABC transporter ATP-binding protein [Hydrogenoanaerobacterium sp.]